METETGTPVQFMKWNKSGHWDIMPAVISKVEEANVSITVIGKKSNTEIKKAMHADFVKKGKDFWDFLPDKSNGQFRNKLYPWINPDGKLQVLTYRA